MANVPGIDCLEAEFPLQRDGNNLSCWQIQTETALLLVRTSQGMVLCPFVLHNLLNTLSTSRYQGIHGHSVTSLGSNVLLWSEPARDHADHWDFRTVAYEFKPWVNYAGFAFILPYALQQQIKGVITGKENIFTLIVYSSEDTFLRTSPSLAAVEERRTDWSLGCRYHPREPPGHRGPEALLVVGGNCKKPRSAGYAPILNVNLNHWHV